MKRNNTSLKQSGNGPHLHLLLLWSQRPQENLDTLPDYTKPRLSDPMRWKSQDDACVWEPLWVGQGKARQGQETVRCRSPTGWLFTEVYVALQFLVSKERLWPCMQLTESITDLCLYLRQVSCASNAFPCPPRLWCSKGSRALLEGAASLEGSPVGRLTCTEAGVCGSIILCDNEIGDPPASFSRQVE